MSISKSILENFSLESGIEVYVQSSSTSYGVSLSFDSSSQNYMQGMTIEEAQTLADRLNKVITEAKENGKA